jgi:uncharacterized protein YndB with AHSA1/START domain
MKTTSIKLSIVIPAEPDEVFAALTEPRHIAAWSGQKGKIAAKVGGKFEFFDGWVKGKVLEYKPGKRLSHTWLPGDWPAGTEASVVRYTLTPSGKGTKIVLEHSHFPNETEKKNHKLGWKEFVLDPLTTHFTAKQ